jgi:hypothetical protein
LSLHARPTEAGSPFSLPRSKGRNQLAAQKQTDPQHWQVSRHDLLLSVRELEIHPETLVLDGFF